ncbi:hypothetical protein F6V25_05145 [Oryzomonas japonica]|uniref:AP2/ERF domain-containing protein n=1 Tax=Oryzomonas japonica TaxID=2603858 RepID=A0A7J4ZTQ4_9BACT|nr:hypothetical protein [Oryzomonas japonica]KAB0666802.1 hypothetical protein F6V25_05145 [Oryzomonas japonica]
MNILNRKPLKFRSSATRDLCQASKRSSLKFKCGNKTGYFGVKLRTDGRFDAYISVDGKKIYCGMSSTAAGAAIAYDRKAIEIFGELAVLNFGGFE